MLQFLQYFIVRTNNVIDIPVWVRVRAIAQDVSLHRALFGAGLSPMSSSIQSV
jgi:hypothetical protein